MGVLKIKLTEIVNNNTESAKEKIIRLESKKKPMAEIQ